MNGYGLPVDIGLAQIYATQANTMKRLQRKENKLELYLQFIGLYAKLETSPLMGSILSVRFRGMFGSHNRLSPQFLLVAGLRRSMRSCVGLYRVTYK